MISRTEICSQMKVFDVLLANVHYYVFSFPVYDSMYVGKHMFPEDEFYYLIPSDVYVKLVSLTNYDMAHHTGKCQYYVDNEIISPILNDKKIFQCIGNKKEFKGSELSAVMQSIVRHAG